MIKFIRNRRSWCLAVASRDHVVCIYASLPSTLSAGDRRDRHELINADAKGAVLPPFLDFFTIRSTVVGLKIDLCNCSLQLAILALEAAACAHEDTINKDTIANEDRAGYVGHDRRVSSALSVGWLFDVSLDGSCLIFNSGRAHPTSLKGPRHNHVSVERRAINQVAPVLRATSV